MTSWSNYLQSMDYMLKIIGTKYKKYQIHEMF